MPDQKRGENKQSNDATQKPKVPHVQTLEGKAGKSTRSD